jgi:ribose transport system ATP-binding protein
MAEALTIEGVSKSFGGRRVLADATIRVRQGETLGLVGQNGSGKSTLIKILSGVYAPDPGGRIAVLGRNMPLPVPPHEPGRRGMAFVHQDLGLFEDGSLLENLRIGRYQTGLGWRIRWRSEREACIASLRRVGIDASPDTPVHSLSQIDKALLAIARAVDQARTATDGGVLVLDEPTSYLPRDGVERLFSAVRELRADGFGIVFVSHRIDEILSLCDTVSVLRDGRVVGALDAPSATEDDIVETMLGRSLAGFYPEHGETGGEVVFAARGVAGDGIDNLDIEVRRGEIYGVTGLLGMGQERLLYLLAGATKARGEIEVAGERIALAGMTTRLARRAGIALLPADRLRASGVQEATAQENVTLATLGRYVRGGRVNKGLERSAALALMHDFQVQPPDPDRVLRTFSGGNQQKTLLAKWLTAEPKVLLLHEPTQGVDVGAKQQIFRLIRDAADAGVAVIVATTEYEDLAGVCNRVLVLREGRRAAELAGANLTQDRLVEECYRSERTTS